MVAPGRSIAADRPAPKRTEVAEGIYLFQTAPYGEVGLDGNSVAIYVVDWFLHRVYDELNGPLTNAIAPIPKS
jgi:hypothetical protein